MTVATRSSPWFRRQHWPTRMRFLAWSWLSVVMAAPIGFVGLHQLGVPAESHHVLGDIPLGHPQPIDNLAILQQFNTRRGSVSHSPPVVELNESEVSHSRSPCFGRPAPLAALRQ